MEEDFQRWTARRKVELLLQLIKGEAKLVDVCREHDFRQFEVEGWMDILWCPPGFPPLAVCRDEGLTY